MNHDKDTRCAIRFLNKSCIAEYRMLESDCSAFHLIESQAPPFMILDCNWGLFALFHTVKEENPSEY